LGGFLASREKGQKMGFKKSIKLAKQFIKAQGGFTLWEVEQHYQPLMAQCKTPDELGALHEEWRRVRAGYVAPWMEAAQPRVQRTCASCGAIDMFSGDVCIECGASR
jgi:hypothetical protein